MLRGSVQRLPLWVYGAIAAMLGMITAAAWGAPMRSPAPNF